MSWLFNSNKKEEKSSINWNNLNSSKDLNELNQTSGKQLVLIFKHSTRCSISTMALSRFEREWDYSNEDIKPYFLDLISYREISSLIAETYGIKHESPQVLVIKDGQCIHHTSHQMITAKNLLEL